MAEIPLDPFAPEAYYGWRATLDVVEEQAGTAYVVSCRFMLGQEQASKEPPFVLATLRSQGAARRFYLLAEAVVAYVNTGGDLNSLARMTEGLRGKVVPTVELVESRHTGEYRHFFMESDGNYTIVVPDRGAATVTPAELAEWLRLEQREQERVEEREREQRQRAEGTYVPYAWLDEFGPEEASHGETGLSGVQSLPPPSA